jgi:hypothetical protein
MKMQQINQMCDTIMEQATDFLFLCNHRKKGTYFTRSTGKVTFPQLILFPLTLPKMSAQLECNQHFARLGSDNTMTKQAFSEARMKVSYTAFQAIADTFARNVYSDNIYRTTHGFRLIAVDGSEFNLPAGAAAEFGTVKTGGHPAVRARALALVDVCNDIILGSKLTKLTYDERTLACELITEHYTKGIARPDDLFVFDRGFPSQYMIEHLENLGAKYLFRVSSQFLKPINDANEEDQLVTLNGSDGKQITVRVLNITLPSGAIEKLLTNVLDPAVTVEDFKELYNQRWGIEVKFLELKVRLEIEDFTSCNKNLILQDFYATVCIANMIALAKNEAKEAVEAENQTKQRKYDYKLNGNLAIGTIRPILIEALVTLDPVRREQLFRYAIRKIQDFTLPIRPERSFPRRVKNPSAKFSMNKKRNR